MTTATIDTMMREIVEQFAQRGVGGAAERVHPLLAARRFLAVGWGSVVYFVQAGADGPIKIGTARDLDRRLAQLRGQSPAPLRVLWLMPGGRCLERQMHRRFYASRLHGEWFSPSEDLTAWIEDALTEGETSG